jgi:hypothetical protein
MDLDKQIASLEGKTTFASFGSKAIAIKGGIALILSIVVIYLIKPVFILKINSDPKKKEELKKIDYKNLAIASIVLTVVIYFILNKCNLF